MNADEIGTFWECTNAEPFLGAGWFVEPVEIKNHPEIGPFHPGAAVMRGSRSLPV